MTTPHPAEEPVDSLGQGIDASTMPEHAFEGHRVGTLFGLLVGAGAPPNQTVTPPPYEDADQFQVVRPINAPQLADELSAALARTVLTSITGWDGTFTISDAQPVTLWVSPSGLDPSVIQAVLDNHSPVSTYGISAADQAFADVLQKIASNRSVTLSSTEQNTLIVGLGLDYLSRQSTTIEPSFTPSASNT